MTKSFLAIFIMVFGLVFLTTGGESAAQTADDAALHPPFKVNNRTDSPHRILAKPSAKVTGNQAARSFLARAGAGVRLHKRYSATGGWEVFEIPAGTDAQEAANSLAATGAYAFVEKDQIWTTQATPNDPAYLNGLLWGLHNTGQNSGTADADIDAPEAWDIRTSANPVIVAVIDTGIRYTHQDLAANMWVNPGEIPGNGIDDNGSGYIDDVHGINAINGSGNPMDDNGHGTHCAGTIGGVGNNGTGVAGVAWNVRLMALKFLSAGGSGFTSDAIECIDYARRNGARIMSNSWGGGGYSQALFDAIAAAEDAGILFVAAAGNSSSDNDSTENYPANYLLGNVVSVAATTRRDGLASFSSFGAGFVDLGAPGQDIYSTVSNSNSAYDTYSGTSMATPHVSGALALMAAQYPGDSARQLINRLHRSVDAIPSLTNKTLTGGRLNLQKALSSTSAAPFNDSFASAARLTGSTVYLRAGNISASVETGEPQHADAQSSAASVWWRWTAPANATVSVDLSGSDFDTLLSVYSGSTFTGLSEVAGNDDAGAGTTTSKVTFSAVAGTEYRIAVASKSASATGMILLKLSTPPANDAFVTPAVLAGEPVTVEGTNNGASKEPGEPNHAGNAGGNSVWYRWEAPQTGKYRIVTSGSSFDTLLAIYTGNAVASLTQVAQNDNESGFLTTSGVRMDAVAGTSYRIAVDGKNGATGSVRLSIVRPAPNDAFEDRITLVGSNITAVGNNIGATKQSGEPAHGGNSGGSSVWWTWTAAGIGPVEINTIGSDFDTTLGVYTGSAVNALATIASNDDGGPNLTSRVTFNPVPGTTYQIAVDGFSADTGNIVLNLIQSVINFPPVVTSATIAPNPSAWLDEVLQVVSVVANDADGDEITLAYEWQFSVNGYQFTDAPGENGPVLTADEGRSGRLWRCRITPSDSFASGVPFFTEAVSVNRRPMQVAYHGQNYGYDSDLFLRSQSSVFPRPAIINEISQGPSGGTSEWLEILFLLDTNVQGWTLRDTNSPDTITFSSGASLWSNVPAGTLLVIYKGPSNRDPVLPPDDLDPGDGRMIVPSNAAGLFTGTWPGLSNSRDDGFAVRDAGGSLIDGVSINNQTSFQPRLGTVGSTRSARYNGDTEAGAELASQWSIVSSAAGVVTPGAGNNTANTLFVDKLRNGFFDDKPLFRWAASSELVPGLSIDPETGEISGTPSIPAGGFFDLVIERYTSVESSFQSFSLLVGSADHVFVIPAGRTWSLDGPVFLDGSLRADGTLITNGFELIIRQTFQSWLAMHHFPDDDGDAYGLLLEYAFDLDPDTSDPASIPSIAIEDNQITLKYRRQKSPTELVYHLESSSNLVQWEHVDMDDWQMGPPESLAPDAEEITLSKPEPDAGDPLFFRIRVQQPSGAPL